MSSRRVQAPWWSKAAVNRLRAVRRLLCLSKQEEKVSKMSILPRDLLQEVLLRLAVEDLSRLRRVSKSWKTLIDSPEFIKQHLKRSSARSLVSDVYGDYTFRKFCIMDCLEESPKRMKATAKLYCMRDEWYWSSVQGSCNGLICLLLTNSRFKLPHAVLWNPCTHQILQLPLGIEDGIRYWIGPHFSCFGLGYDEVHDDYKVVRLLKYCKQNDTSASLHVAVYSLGSNCWTESNLEFPYKANVSLQWCVLANGALHWVVTTSNVIVAFNLTTKKYHLIDFYIDPALHLLHFGLLNGCLCLSVSAPVLIQETDAFADFWIMKEYGVKDSWTKLSFKRPPPNPGKCYDRYSWKPVSFCSNSRYTLLQNDRYLTRYDTEKRLYDDVVVLNYVSTSERMRGYVFIPSLVRLPGATNEAPWKPHSRFRSLLPSCLFPRRNQGSI